jgi:hypothetical protein
MGPFGWADDLLSSTVGVADHPLVNNMARLMAHMVSGELPRAVYFVMSCGTLTPLNKISEEANATRVASGLPHKVRPVNSGVNLTKRVIGMATKSKSGRKAKKRLMPTQMGCGTPAGPETTALTMQALHETGWTISKEDGVNGFNAISRQAVCDAVHEG